MKPLDTAVIREALRSENDLLGDLYRDADPETPIPTCGDWRLKNLLAHVGGGHRWAARMITLRSTERVEFADVPDVRRPRDPAEVDGWFRPTADAVIDAVDATGRDVPVWTPFGALRPAEWWIRRRLHENTGHRADALLALGQPVSIDPVLGADGLEEFLGLLEMGSARFRNPLDDGTSLLLQATDTGDAWSVRRTEDSIGWTDSTEPATATVRGAAVDLYLLLLGRIPADSPVLTVSGDAAVLPTWLARTQF
ncbi:maleylpyruvate isomerase family mycothiol-dependent enzyme [Nocardia sp. alder85J]|uniref:maleylpyruvate isomerase family mycothiol-dependent enzyme n=1 Tax=Nocardia sp. alder85J TaxID=2862949 RepID=UPI001CD55627|nr:maleylpyruvate isomerase family mycothiol-dependent enzyme [Nocardia sp. alder85J]MCX4097460.1 maleylpyruvate isomerase family mycothiol-dependent enzyme [Nocardia sp. alder85J]